MKRLTYRLLPGLLALLLGLAACAPAAEEQGSEGLLDPENPTAVTVWTYYNGAQLTAFNQAVEEFNLTRGSEVGVVVTGVSQGSVTDLEDKVLAAAQGQVGAETMPNMFAAYADTAYAMDRLGLVADLAPYLTGEELDAFVPSYRDEGRLGTEGGLKIFPLAKSVEVFFLNETAWAPFAQETGATYEDLATMEGLTATAQAYYEWTDGQTEAPNDGRAFFGRDAMANYFLIGGMQLGCEIFQVEGEQVTLQFDEQTARRLWDNYYIPFIKGYFAASGRFRSDDVKTGNVIAVVGSSAGATFFPRQVTISDTESLPIAVTVLPCPQFEGGSPFAVQQGAGMVVTQSDPAQVAASVEFLKWFTQDERNIAFSVNSGYLPVNQSANTMEAIRPQLQEDDPLMEGVLSVAVDTVAQTPLYTTRAFAGGTDARTVLEGALGTLAATDRQTVADRLAQGASLEDATADFTTDDYFMLWYQDILTRLQAAVKG